MKYNINMKRSRHGGQRTTDDCLMRNYLNVQISRNIGELVGGYAARMLPLLGEEFIGTEIELPKIIQITGGKNDR